MKSNNNVKKLVLALMLVAIVGVSGISYAYFTVQRMGSNGNAISGKASIGGPKLSYTENKEGVSLKNTYPMPDELGASKSEEYIFSIKNEETVPVKAKVLLEVAETSTLDDSLLNISINGTIVTLSTLNKGSASKGFKQAYVLMNTSLEGGNEKSNTIKVWVNENGTVDNAQNKTWVGKILVVPEFE